MQISGAWEQALSLEIMRQRENFICGVAGTKLWWRIIGSFAAPAGIDYDGTNVSFAGTAFGLVSNMNGVLTVQFNANAETADGTPYAKYTVKCSNGKTAALTAWDNRRKWCVGDATSENCEKKQIKAAKAACKASR